MAEGHKRYVLQKVAESKLTDATILLANKRYSGAFYLAGYAVEIGLKACIARRMYADTIPDKQLILATYTHVFKDLVGVAGLKKQLDDEINANQLFAAYWGIAGEWRPEARYDVAEAASAQYLVQAVGDAGNGILRWIKQHW